MPAALFGYCRVKGFGPVSIVNGESRPNLIIEGGQL